MAKSSDHLTPRQRQSQRIMREKAARKKREAVARKCLIGFLGAFALVSLIGGGWAWYSGAAQRTLQATQDRFYALTVQAGFGLQTMYLEGRSRTSSEEIQKALAIEKGDSVLAYSLDEARARLEAIESVRFAAVERELPGTLYVRIVEREPVALWQHQGKISLVDDQGSVMSDIDSTPYQKLPLIVGEDAPKHVGELLQILSSEPELAKRFEAAVRVGDRRWNVRLDKQLEIKLPEENALAAWQTLAQLQNEQKLLDRAVKVIDLRLPDRLFITLTPDVLQPTSPDAKET